MDTNSNRNSNTLTPDEGQTIRVDAGPQIAAGDRTVVIGHQMMPDAAITDHHNDEDTTLRTLRPEVQPVINAQPAGESFLLHDEYYLKKTCLSDNSGEAQVFLVEHNGKEYVLKVYYPNFDVNKKLLQVIMNFQFEMIVRLIDFGKTYVDGKRRSYELMEYLQGGTLQEYHLNGNLNKFRRIALQAAAALAYCHKNNILHKDIKPGNFFFRDKEQKELVLGDFGISSMLEKEGKTYRTTQARTPIYAAPEMYADVIDGEVEITSAADYYSLGITLFAVWLGENPMSSNERVMMKQKSEGRLPRLNELPEQVRHIVQGLTAANPPSRWKYEEVERWFLGEDVPIDISSPFLRYKTFIVDPDRNLVAENVHELVPLLMANEKLARSYLYNGRITTWLEQSGNTKLATAVKDIVTERYPADQRAGLMAAVFAMEPTYPYRDVRGTICDDLHSISLSLLSNQERYFLELQNPNNELYIWLESHTKCDVNRLRSYFRADADERVALLKLVFEIDSDIPFLTRCPSSTMQEIVHAFGYNNPSEDEWHSLTDGRLLSWMYCRGDVMACESLRILTQNQPYSQALAYKVLYNMDRDTAYDLREARTPEDIGNLLAEKLKQTEHLSAEDFATEIDDFSNPNGRFYYYAQLHGWNEYIAEATRCFDLNLPENRERLSAYDLRTAAYRFCRILGVVPAYLLPNGTLLTDGRNIDRKQTSAVKSEFRSGVIAQWLSVFFHENPSEEFKEEYSYERALEEWVLELGSFDNQQSYYKRFVKAREETAERVKEVRRQWLLARWRDRVWRFSFYALCAVWILLVMFYGITGHSYILYRHWILSIVLPIGGMLGLIIGIRAFFRGFGALMSILSGLVGVALSLIPLYGLRWVDLHHPTWFNATVALLTLLFIVFAYVADFRNDNQTDSKFIQGILNENDVKSSLLEPLYYTFKTKSLRYKSSKFGLLDDISDQMRGTSGESAIHYGLCCALMAILISMFCLFSPAILDVKMPGHEEASEVMEQIQKNME